MTPRFPVRFASLLAMALVAAGCGVQASSETDAMTPAFQPAVTIYATNPPAQASPEASPTVPATSLPQAAVTETPQPDDGSINPFTGLRMGDPAVLDRVPMLVKVANTPDVRPQHGLDQADVVVEHYSEGGITRYTALYLTHAPDRVGSVRSCRLIDIELPRMFGAGLVCSGTSPGVKPTLRASWLFDENRPGDVNASVVMISDLGPFECPTCPMFRTSDRVPPHNLFANLPNAWREMTERDKNQRTPFDSWQFNLAPPNGGSAASQIEIPFTSGPVSWRYAAPEGVWERSIDGAPYVDAKTGKPLTATNILVVYAHHAVTGIQEDVTGARSIQIQIWGDGPLKVFRDGRMVEGKWRRPEEPNVFELVDADGAEIALKPGTTWIEVVPLDFEVFTR